MTGDWWDESWNPIVGCDMSLACAKRCWARKQAHMHKRHPDPKIREKYVGITDDAGCWTGDVRLDERALECALRWRKKRVVAVNLMGDSFYGRVPDEWLDRLYAMMALCPQHHFAVLTKRTERRCEYWSYENRWAQIEAACDDLVGRENAPALAYEGRKPLPNVIEMVSVSTQPELDDRWPWLAKTPAARRGLHIEPLLGPLDIAPVLHCPGDTDGDGNCPHYGHRNGCPPSAKWIVVGGETGPGARPMNPQWVRDLRDQCAAAGVPFWFKGWGEWVPESQMSQEAFEREFHGGIGTKHGADDNMIRVGRKTAGRLLDGKEHNGTPWQ